MAAWRLEELDVDLSTWLKSKHPEIPLEGALAVLRLAAEGGTVPFIARYRKEQTGNLDEVQIQASLDARERYDAIVKRQAFVVEEIERQKKLTPELKEQVLACFDAEALEDLYLPFKKKRKSKATAATEAGIGPLADWIWNCGHGTEQPLPGQTLELWAFTFRNEEAGYKTTEEAIQGAQDILTERLAQTVELRAAVRKQVFEKGFVHTAKGEKAKPSSKFENYFDFHEEIASLQKPQNSHRYLAARRGAGEGEVTLAIGGGPKDPEFEARLLAQFEAAAISVPDSPGENVLRRAARAALKAHVLPAIENEAHRALKDVADETAIKVFAENVRQLLLASPFGSRAVVGIDPGLRTGCKLAVINAEGAYVDSQVLHLQGEEGKARAKQLLAALLSATPIDAIAVGNGTAGRETEAFVRAAVKEAGQAVPVVLVSEAGASVYSASEAAREEFPALDVTVRGAISIARRLQDPLAELVKIDPKSIGVGQYQHDVSQGGLAKTLAQVVDSCVNQVGVNLNTASYHLLAHVSGIGDALAKSIVKHRVEKGLFGSREQLLEVPHFSRKTFELAAGFLRIPGGSYPLDNTGVHPERYPVLESLAGKLGLEGGVADLLGSGVARIKAAAPELRTEVGEYTWSDIVEELSKPGRDPRQAFVPFQFRDDVFEPKDLKPGMICPGVVTNVTNFGAFVDVGVHHDGLVHISQLSDHFVKDPREVLKPGDRVEVRVLEVNLEKTRISLTMKKPQAPRAPKPRPEKKQERKPAAPRAEGAQAQPQPPRGPRRPPQARPAPEAQGARPERRPQAPRPEGARPPQGPRPPQAPRPAEARPQDRRGAQDRRPAPPPQQPPRKGGEPFNNSFAKLADLRDALRTRR
jgi:uncharacterized protein